MNRLPAGKFHHNCVARKKGVREREGESVRLIMHTFIRVRSWPTSSAIWNQSCRRWLAEQDEKKGCQASAARKIFHFDVRCQISGRKNDNFHCLISGCIKYCKCLMRRTTGWRTFFSSRSASHLLRLCLELIAGYGKVSECADTWLVCSLGIQRRIFCYRP